MKIVHRLLLVLLISIFLFGCSGKKSGIEGKLVDGQGQPISGAKVIIKQVQPIKGYEQFEMTTGSDGVFRFNAVMPVSEYIITPVSDKWKTKITQKVSTGTEGQTLVLNSPISIRFNLMRDGSVVDTKTGLQWLIYAGTDLSFENVINTVKNVREGGFADWRLPTKSEIASLQEKATPSGFLVEIDYTHEACCTWTVEPNSENVEWDFFIDDGNELWASSKIPANDRIVVVRAAGGTPSAVLPPPVAMPAPIAATPQPPAFSPAPAPPAPVIVEKKEAPAPAVKKEEAAIKEPAAKKKVAPVVPKKEKAAAPAKKEAAVPAPAKKEEVKEAPVQAPAPAPAAPAEKVEPTAISGNNVIVHFTVNKSAISPEDLAKLKAFFAKAKATAGARIVIEGHSDSAGSSSGKLKISIDRAFSVLDMLKKLGLSDKTVVEIKGMGDAKPAAENDSEEGRKLNRRVEVNLIQ
jgi:outer membrane protein OmpA-like peptidoglycan-associated protein